MAALAGPSGVRGLPTSRSGACSELRHCVVPRGHPVQPSTNTLARVRCSGCPRTPSFQEYTVRNRLFPSSGLTSFPLSRSAVRPSPGTALSPHSVRRSPPGHHKTSPRLCGDALACDCLQSTAQRSTCHTSSPNSFSQLGLEAHPGAQSPGCRWSCSSGSCAGYYVSDLNTSITACSSTPPRIPCQRYSTFGAPSLDARSPSNSGPRAECGEPLIHNIRPTKTDKCRRV